MAWRPHEDLFSFIICIRESWGQVFDKSPKICNFAFATTKISNLWAKVQISPDLGDNVNAIEVQIWVTMIAYLLLRVMQHKAKCKLAFSNIVTLARLTIGNYVNFVTLLNCPKQAWAERLRYWNSLETAQNTVQLELQFSP